MIKLVLLDHAKADRLAESTCHANIRQIVVQSLSETFECAMSSQVCREDAGMSILPAVIPKPGKPVDLRAFR
ncbi:hypothetical protein [Mesorhizobium xinjiangense]|uniref:hypothetical protein n=1 Tax=Mesorhizobium xinjiangense TaxID=2678685 RepID=UPI002E2763FC